MSLARALALPLAVVRSLVRSLVRAITLAGAALLAKWRRALLAKWLTGRLACEWCALGLGRLLWLLMRRRFVARRLSLGAFGRVRLAAG